MAKVEEANKVLSNKNLLLLLGLATTIVVFLITLIIRNKIARKKELYFIQQKEKNSAQNGTNNANAGANKIKKTRTK